MSGFLFDLAHLLQCISPTTLLLKVLWRRGFWAINSSLEVDLDFRAALWKELDLFLAGETPDQYKVTPPN